MPHSDINFLEYGNWIFIKIEMKVSFYFVP